MASKKKVLAGVAAVGGALLFWKKRKGRGGDEVATEGVVESTEADAPADA